MNLCDYHEIQTLLARHGFRFSKAKGQNFLVRDWVPRRIAEAAGIDGSCGVLEVGPGVGPLTAALCERAGKVLSIEVDQSLQPVLAETLAGLTTRGFCLATRSSWTSPPWCGRNFPASALWPAPICRTISPRRCSPNCSRAVASSR